MKKQYFIFSAVACMMAIFSVKAQNTPIDDFLKKYPSREGVTSVTMSQQMLQSIFAPSDNSNSVMSTSGEKVISITTVSKQPAATSPSEETSEVTVTGTGVQRKQSTVTSTSDGKVVSGTTVSKQPAVTSPSEETAEVIVTGTGVQRKQSTVTSTSDGKVVSVVAAPGQNTSTPGGAKVFGFDVINQNLNTPEAYSSVTMENTPENLFTNFKNTLLSSRYEQFMEINKENSNILGYYMKKVNDSINEIVVIRQQTSQFSAIYIKGNIKIDQVDKYLSKIKNALERKGFNTSIIPT